MKEPRPNPVSARVTDKAYKKMLAVADKHDWTESKAISNMLEWADTPKPKTPRKAKKKE